MNLTLELCIYSFNFYGYCHNIVIVNYLGRSSHVVKIRYLFFEIAALHLIDMN